VERIFTLVKDEAANGTALVEETLNEIDQKVDRLFGCTGYESSQRDEEPERNGAERHRTRP